MWSTVLRESSGVENAMKLAVTGKGGSGKTTIAGTLARSFARKGWKVLAIDGDVNPNLALTLGLPRDAAFQVAAIPRDLLQRTTDPLGNQRVRLSMPSEAIIQAYGVQTGDAVKLLVMGRIEHAGAG